MLDNHRLWLFKLDRSVLRRRGWDVGGCFDWSFVVVVVDGSFVVDRGRWGRVRGGVVAVVVDRRRGAVSRAGLVVLLRREEVHDFLALLGQKSGLAGRVVAAVRRRWRGVLVIFEALFFAAENAAAVGGHVEVDERLLNQLALFVGARLERDEGVDVNGAQRNSARDTVRADAGSAAAVVRVDGSSGAEEIGGVPAVGSAVLRKTERDSKSWVDASNFGRGEVEEAGQGWNAFEDSL
jgi:hypothetical protein